MRTRMGNAKVRRGVAVVVDHRLEDAGDLDQGSSVRVRLDGSCLHNSSVTESTEVKSS